MKTFLLATALAASVLHAAPLAAQEAAVSYQPPAAELVEAQHIINVMFPHSDREAIFGKMIGDIGQQFAASLVNDPVFTDPGIKAILDDFFAGLPATLMPTVRKHMPAILDATAIAYTREFSLEELRQIRAFADTPAGSRYLRKATELLSDPAVAAANQAYFTDLQVLQRTVNDELRAKVMEYLKAHPEALERLEAGRSASPTP